MNEERDLKKIHSDLISKIGKDIRLVVPSNGEEIVSLLVKMQADIICYKILFDSLHIILKKYLINMPEEDYKEIEKDLESLVNEIQSKLKGSSPIIIPSRV